MNVATTSLRGIEPHTLPRPKGLIECDTVLDIGAGIRPMQWYKPARHWCVEPHAPYRRVLEDAGYTVIADTALGFLLCGPSRLGWDVLYFLDVIEHMPKTLGFAVIEQAMVRTNRQIVIYTPMGFKEQSADPWGLGGEYWQTHRSGWTPEDFPGWEIELYRVPTKNGRDTEGFFALWTPTAS